MLHIQDGIIHITTRHTSYVLSTQRDGLPENLHYGARITLANPSPLLAKASAGYGCDVLRKPGQPALSGLCLELSPTGRGDYRRSALLADMSHGSTCEFTLATIQQKPATLSPAGGMPQAQNPDETLVLSLSEPSGLCVELYYSIFYEADVITKKMRVTNQGESPLTLRRCLSHQLDLPSSEYELFTLQGAWARECHLHRHPLAPGIQQFGSTTGASGNRCNPFFFLAEASATEHAGGVYGFNLVYSGSHEYSVEVDAFGRTRILQGVSSEGFGWPLAPGQSFTTPEAVLTYSAHGKNGMSQNMHKFVKSHIIPARWQDAPRPVLVNNWEGTYFNFNEAKILGMAKVAAKLGVELFVLDDGWFGARNSDKAALGDYTVNRKKLPNGLSGLARKINGLGMQFGLWFEPEMVNPDSELYRVHPDWAVQAPGYVPAQGRNQLVLDLCRDEVRHYIIQSIGDVLRSANISYVKWDMNRHISDNYSPVLDSQGSFMHRYTLGLYQIMQEVCAAHPDVLFEGCSSGGNRFDLGILHYMPQIWTSDDTDAHERQKIQTGTSYGYPPCTMGCHVSAVPGHQTLRVIPLETRFNTAIFGLLGYEMDMRTLTRHQREDIAAQIEFYKKHRALLQYGNFMRLQSPFEGDSTRWIVVSLDKSEAMLGDFCGLLTPNSALPPMRAAGLDARTLYRIQARTQKIDITAFGGLINHILPVHLNPEGAIVNTASKFYRMQTEDEAYTAYGDLLCTAGIVRQQAFSGAGYADDMRLVHDFSSRVYYIKSAPQP